MALFFQRVIVSCGYIEIFRRFYRMYLGLYFLILIFHGFLITGTQTQDCTRQELPSGVKCGSTLLKAGAGDTCSSEFNNPQAQRNYRLVNIIDNSPSKAEDTFQVEGIPPVTINRGVMLLADPFVGAITVQVNGGAGDLEGFTVQFCELSELIDVECRESSPTDVFASATEKCFLSKGFPRLPPTGSCSYRIIPNTAGRAVAAEIHFTDLSLSATGTCFYSLKLESPDDEQCRLLRESERIEDVERDGNLLVTLTQESSTMDEVPGYIVCFKTEVIGNWASWGEWSTCTASCTRSRSRTCTDPAPSRDIVELQCDTSENGDTETDKDCCPKPPDTGSGDKPCSSSISSSPLGSSSSGSNGKGNCQNDSPGSRYICMTYICLLIYFLLGYASAYDQPPYPFNMM